MVRSALICHTSSPLVVSHPAPLLLKPASRLMRPRHPKGGIVS
jgi:hypothetical protein